MTAIREFAIAVWFCAAVPELLHCRCYLVRAAIRLSAGVQTLGH